MRNRVPVARDARPPMPEFAPRRSAKANGCGSEPKRRCPNGAAQALPEPQPAASAPVGAAA